MLTRMFAVERNIDRVIYAKPGDPARYGFHSLASERKRRPLRSVLIFQLKEVGKDD